jgi:aspartate racemase
MIGILGGMGPLATADFFSKVIAATPAKRDEDHVPLLIQSDPRIPGRPAAILRGGESPLPALMAGRDRLIAAGAIALAMPCNTAHVWLPELRQGCPVPFLSIVDASCDEAAARAKPGAAIGIIGTEATLKSRLFDSELAKRGFKPVLPTEEELRDLILPAIEQVKAGRAAEGGELACTETPLALDAIASPLRERCVDTNAALARTCVAWWAGRAA